MYAGNNILKLVLDIFLPKIEKIVPSIWAKERTENSHENLLQSNVD